MNFPPDCQLILMIVRAVNKDLNWINSKDTCKISVMLCEHWLYNKACQKMLTFQLLIILYISPPSFFFFFFFPFKCKLSIRNFFLFFKVSFLLLRRNGLTYLAWWNVLLLPVWPFHSFSCTILDCRNSSNELFSA